MTPNILFWLQLCFYDSKNMLPWLQIGFSDSKYPLLDSKYAISDSRYSFLTPNMLLWRLVRKRCQLRRVWRPLAPPLHLVHNSSSVGAPRSHRQHLRVYSVNTAPCVNSVKHLEEDIGRWQVCEAPGSVNILRWTTWRCQYLKVNSLSCEHLACDIGQKKSLADCYEHLTICSWCVKKLSSCILQTDVGLKTVWEHLGSKPLLTKWGFWPGRSHFEGLSKSM